jgi:hypothetical protein
MAVGKDERPISTTREIVTGPSAIAFMRASGRWPRHSVASDAQHHRAGRLPWQDGPAAARARVRGMIDGPELRHERAAEPAGGQA